MLNTRSRFTPLAILFALLMSTLMAGGCSTIPKPEKQAEFLSDAAEATQWFESNVNGLSEQIEGSAGYIVYPSVVQWGILVSGGQYGRGVVMAPDNTQVGWAAINSYSIGLQIGGHGFKMLVVFQDQVAFDSFRENKLTGSASSMAVVGINDACATGAFHDRVVVYKGDNSGLMAGVNLGLDYMRYKPLEDTSEDESSE